MQAIELLTTRSSMPRLVAPGPTHEQLQLMFQAACRAPDHMALMPYSFTLYQEQGRAKLGAVFASAAKARELNETQIAQAQELPLRAPAVIMVAMRAQQHDKVPRDEQLACAACATLLLQQAAFAQGLGAIWRTGWLAEDEVVKAQLGLAPADAIVGFLYVGTPAVATPIKPDKDWQSKVEIVE